METLLLIGGIFFLVKYFDSPTKETMSKFPISKDSHKLLRAFAEQRGFYVTSDNTGKHNVGSKHYLGRAIDVRTHDKTQIQCEAFIAEAKAAGITVRDERVKPKGQKVWSGPHIHLEV
jgi:hypothetical protein